MPTGDPDMPDHIRHAKDIHRDWRGQMGLMVALVMIMMMMMTMTMNVTTTMMGSMSRASTIMMLLKVS